MQITTIGLDIAKNVFQVHGIDAEEKVVVRKATSFQLATQNSICACVEVMARNSY